MYDKFEYTCKSCKNIFYTKALKSFSLKQPELQINLEINLQQHFTTNSVSQTFDTPKGKITISLEDIQINAKCSVCNKERSYFLSEINPI